MKASLSSRKIKELTLKIKLLETSLSFLLGSLNKLNLTDEQLDKLSLILQELKGILNK